MTKIAAVFLALAIAAPATAREIAVQSTQDLGNAIAHAQPGDNIVLGDGIYVIAHKLQAQTAGAANAPISVRARHPLQAKIRSLGWIAFEITAPYWHFSGLDIRGVCADDSTCEHAFHVVGAASHFQLTGNHLVDFNAQLKVNADPLHHLPADGLVENNEFFDSHPRHTDNPVAPVNIDNALRWVVRGNLIHDFQKDGTGEDSYGAFVKGGSVAPVIEQNIIECGNLGPPLGHNVGLSLGAHGMDRNLCPPAWDSKIPCDPEVSGGIIRNNIISNCSGDGIYLNKARDSKILFNSLAHTAGIEFHLPGSTGLARGNLLTGRLFASDGGSFSDGGNVTLPAIQGDLANRRKTQTAGAKAGLLSLAGPDPLVANDFCGRPRGKRMQIGAMQKSAGPCPPLTWPR